MVNHRLLPLILGIILVFFSAVLVNARSSPPHPGRPTNVLFASVYLAGHFTPMKALAEELAKDPKYKIYFISQDEAKGKIKNENITFCTIGPAPIKQEALGIFGQDISVYEKLVKIFHAGVIWTKDFYRSVDKIVKNNGAAFQDGTCSIPKPDWIVSDVGTWGALLAAADHNIPTISNCATLIAEMNSMSPSYVPMLLTGKSIYMNLSDRFFNLFWDKIKFGYLFYQLDSQLNQFRAEEFNLTRRSVVDIYDSELYLINSAYGFEYARLALGPYVNPHPAPISSFTTEYPALVEWFSSIPKDTKVVYIAFGSMVSMSLENRKAILDGVLEIMEKLPVYALWSLPDDKAQPLKEHIPSAYKNKFVFASWVPQASVLNDPRVFLYINHGGIGSVHESLIFGKPQIVIPSETDTFDAAVRVVDAGAGLQLDYKTFDKHVIAATTFAVWHNNQFQESAKKVGQMLLSAGGVKRAAEVSKSVMEIGSGDHLKLYERDLPWYHVHLGTMCFAILVITLFQCLKSCVKICIPKRKTLVAKKQ